jgi:hypothetical protein
MQWFGSRDAYLNFVLAVEALMLQPSQNRLDLTLLAMPIATSKETDLRIFVMKNLHVDSIQPLI